jgi:site-specific DNA recombinase
MSPSFAVKGNKRYRYYICTNAMQKGYRTCPSKSVPAGQIEEFVVDKIQRLEHDSALIREICQETDRYEAGRIQGLAEEKATMLRELARWKGELTEQVLGENGHRNGSRLISIQERMVSIESRLAVIDREIAALRLPVLPEHESGKLLAAFRPAWDELAVCEQAKIAGLLIEHVEYHGGEGKIRIKFNPAGIQAIARHLAVRV